MAKVELEDELCELRIKVSEQRWPKGIIADSSTIHRPVLRLAINQRALEVWRTSSCPERMSTQEGEPRVTAFGKCEGSSRGKNE
jgi:hypothetical protein